MKRTPCDHVEQQLSRYQDGELDRLNRWRARRHLQHCAHCAATDQATRDLQQQVADALLSAPPPSYLTAAVMRRLPAMPAATRSSGADGRWRPWHWVLGAGCAALQVAALFGAYRFGYTRGQAGPTAPARPPIAQRAPVAPPAAQELPLPASGMAAWMFINPVASRPDRRRLAPAGRLSLQGAR